MLKYLHPLPLFNVPCQCMKNHQVNGNVLERGIFRALLKHQVPSTLTPPIHTLSPAERLRLR